jgi:hypothetical protein
MLLLSVVIRGGGMFASETVVARPNKANKAIPIRALLFFRTNQTPANTKAKDRKIPLISVCIGERLKRFAAFKESSPSISAFIFCQMCFGTTNFASLAFPLTLIFIDEFVVFKTFGGFGGGSSFANAFNVGSKTINKVTRQAVIFFTV